MFIIIHEIFHKMNECVINDNNRTLETVARDYLGETVSVLSGFLLGNYLVDNGIITENDFSIRKARRLLNCKENARDVIIENELIKMKLNGKEINKDNALELLNSLDKDSITYEILLNEKNSLYIINDILKNNDLQLSIAQRYVMAWIFSNELLKRNTVVEDFIKLHTALGDENSYFDDICNKILNTEHHNKN